LTITRATLPPPPSTIRSLTNEEARVLDSRMPLRPSVARCITCHGKRSFRWLDDSRQNEVEYECPCVDQFVLVRYLSHCGIPLNYQRMDWADLTAPEVAGAFAEVATYLDSHEHFINAGFGMVFHGSKGNGKTLLAHLMLKSLIAKGAKVYATTFADLVGEFMGSWKDKDQERWFNRTIRNAGVLYIDDLGREFKADRFGGATLTEEQRQAQASADNRMGSPKETLLESVIRHRVANCQPTIISTNYTEGEMLGGYGGHTMSLLAERSTFVEVKGADRRSEMTRRESEYIRRGLTRPVVLT
jgi:DNA replication protein DnaC